MKAYKEQPVAISVIIPIYNAERYLERCLNSIIHNTYENLEILCVNDGSTDRSAEILETFRERDSRIRILEQPNLKVSAARNTGMDASTGEYIAFIDADDWVHPLYFEFLLSAAEQYRAQIVICRPEIRSAQDGRPDHEYEHDASSSVDAWLITVEQLQKDHVLRSRVWGRLYHQDILKNRRFLTGSEPIEDYVFNVQVYDMKPKICVIDKCLYYYYMHPESAIHQKDNGLRILDATLCVLTLLKEKGIDQKDLILWCYKNVLSGRYSASLNTEYSLVAGKCRKIWKLLGTLKEKPPFPDRLILEVMYRFPFVYRLFRIIDDPTLLQWEKERKKEKKRGLGERL